MLTTFLAPRGYCSFVILSHKLKKEWQVFEWDIVAIIGKASNLDTIEIFFLYIFLLKF